MRPQSASTSSLATESLGDFRSGVHQSQCTAATTSTIDTTFDYHNSFRILWTSFKIELSDADVLYYWSSSSEVGDGRNGNTTTSSAQLIETPILDIENTRPPEESFVLVQNYPTPFNPSTVISYQLFPQAGSSTTVIHVTLKIYDALGREVKTSVEDEE